MKTKTIVKAVLLGFVAISLSWLIIKQSSKESPGIESESSSVMATTSVNNPSVPTAPDRVVAYYFHTTSRCSTCYKIESYAKEAIESEFAEELRGGRLVFLAINIEEPEHSHFIKDYELHTKSLVLAEFKNGEQTRWKNLEKVWELVGSKDEFFKYVREESTLYLQGK